MILAAGRGERMRPLTDKTPKPLLHAGSLRLIEHHINALVTAGIKDLVINHAHLGDQIVAELGDGSGYGIRITYSEEPDGALETGGGIFKALPLLKSDPFLVVNGDIWTDYPFSRISNDLVGLAHIVLVKNPSHNPKGDFLLCDNRVSKLEKGLPGQALTFSGIGVYRHALFRGSHPGRFPLLPVLLEAMMKKKVTGEYYDGGWMDVGTIDRLTELNEKLKAKSLKLKG